MKISLLKLLLFVFTTFLLAISCKKENKTPETPILEGSYVVENGQIKENGNAVFFKGVNTLQTFGLGDQYLMDEWNVQINREFIGNLREQPINGSAIQGSDGAWYHPLQQIVDSNRLHNRITILCPFGWVNSSGEQKLFTGLNPSLQVFYNDYKVKMKSIAEQFKNQPDVWIEVWNEPYHWNNENNYNHNLWLNDMKDMVDNLRSVDGFQNIILVPGNEQGQSEDAILSKGKELMEGRYNILFDLHAYEKWLLNMSEDMIVERLEAVKSNELAFIFGEVGVQNVGEIMPVQEFLEAAQRTSISVLAWLWNKNSQDKNALLTDDGLPNASADNNYWGTTYKDFMAN